MEDKKLTTAKEAHDCVQVIMKGIKKKAFVYLGEFNTVLMYLESKMREEQH